MSEEAPIERRALGPAGHHVSIVGLDLGTAPSSSPPVGLGGPRAWAKAIATGVNLADAAFPAASASESRLGAARGGGHDPFYVLVAVAEGRASPPADAGSTRHRVGSALEESRARLGKGARLLPCLLPTQRAWLDRPETVAELRRLEAGGSIAGWGVSVGPGTRIDRLAPVLDAGASYAVVSGNLLDHRALREVSDAVRPSGAALLVRDPHADGLLDGSFLKGSTPMHGQGPRFERWEQLEGRLRPVARLGFLTADRRRSLPEAAVQFVAGIGSVASVFVRADDPETFSASLRGAALPPFTAEEYAELAAATGGLGVPGPSAGPPTEQK